MSPDRSPSTMQDAFQVHVPVVRPVLLRTGDFHIRRHPDLSITYPQAVNICGPFVR